jgi:hypothetical protein
VATAKGGEPDRALIEALLSAGEAQPSPALRDLILADARSKRQHSKWITRRRLGWARR